MVSTKKVTIYKGNTSKDIRGVVRFFNTFTFEKIKRFYQVENSQKNPIRAFHGHFKEEKYVYVISGKILLCIVKLSKPINPSKKAPVLKYILSDDDPQIIHIPRGFANGFKSLSKKANVIFFSTASLEESQHDDFRFAYDYWGKNIWDYEKV